MQYLAGLPIFSSTQGPKLVDCLIPFGLASTNLVRLVRYPYRNIRVVESPGVLRLQTQKTQEGKREKGEKRELNEFDGIAG